MKSVLLESHLGSVDTTA